MKSLEKEKPKEWPKTKYQERTGELTKNEKMILDNLRETIKWLEDYEATFFGLDENVVDRNPELAKYLKDFQKEFSNFEKPAEDLEVVAEAKKSDIVFLGDHHNLRRNQEFSAEFMERVVVGQEEPVTQISEKISAPGRSILALEFISPKHQKAIDEFMLGKMDEETFLKRSHFLEWGDLEHWPGYKKILETAKKFGIRVYGIKFEAKDDEQDLGDKFFAEKLAAVSEKHPQAKLFVHIGNAHLAGGHLPKVLAQTEQFQNKKSVAVLQNIRPLYFSALEKYKNFQIPKVLKVKDGTYNFATAPLITEVVSDIENLKHFAGATEGEEEVWADVLGTEIVTRLRNMTGIGTDERIIDSKDLPPSFFFPSFYSEQGGATILAQLKETLPAGHYQQYLKTLEQKGCVYVPKMSENKSDISFKNSLIIKRFRLKRVIEELAKFVIDPKGEKGDISALQYFCSKLFIPERQPENPVEKKGEKIFIDFLNGKKPPLPR